MRISSWCIHPNRKIVTSVQDTDRYRGEQEISSSTYKQRLVIFGIVSGMRSAPQPACKTSFIHSSTPKVYSCPIDIVFESEYKGIFRHKSVSVGVGVSSE
jgi:hypothetical protein